VVDLIDDRKFSITDSIHRLDGIESVTFRGDVFRKKFGSQHRLDEWRFQTLDIDLTIVRDTHDRNDIGPAD
jgi:hypothetical protein